MDQSDIFAVPVQDRWLLYAPLREVASVVNRSALRALRDGGESTGRLAQVRELLREPVSPPPLRTGRAQPIFLGLIPSRLCNLHCVYCNFGVGGSAPKERMDPAMAVEAIDWTARYVAENGGDTLMIHFFGGEPFIEWDLVEIATHRARLMGAAHNLKVHLEASSNGIYPEERARFIADYFQGMVLSFDGFAEIHDRNRPHADGRGSFDEVVRTARIFSESPIELCLRICATAQNIHDLPDIVRWFCKEFRPKFIDVETLTETELGGKAGLLPPDPIQFARTFLECRRIAAGYGVIANYSADLQELPRHHFCPVGQDALILTPDGRLSSCYLLEPDWQDRGLDMVVGRMERGRGVQLDQAALDRARQLALPARCGRCFARWSCAGGCRVNHSYPGCEDAINDFCAQTRLIVAHTILERLGQPETAATLLADDDATRRLAYQYSDRLPALELGA